MIQTDTQESVTPTPNTETDASQNAMNSKTIPETNTCKDTPATPTYPDATILAQMQEVIEAGKKLEATMATEELTAVGGKDKFVATLKDWLAYADKSIACLQAMASADPGPTKGELAEITTTVKALLDTIHIINQALDRVLKDDNGKTTALEVKPRFSSKPLQTVNYPLDKPNSVIWNQTALAQRGFQWQDGQLNAMIVTSPEGKTDYGVLVQLIFDDLPNTVTFSRELTEYDKTVYVYAAAMAEQNGYITLRGLYQAMRNSPTANPSQADKKNLSDSLRKMSYTRVCINNEAEVRAGTTYRRINTTRERYLLALNHDSIYVDGQLVRDGYTLLEEPILIQFARERGQIEPIPAAALACPGRLSPGKLTLNDYIATRVSHIKNTYRKVPSKKRKSGWNKLLYKTIFANCGIVNDREQRRAKAQIREILNTEKAGGFIKEYIEGKDGITVNF